MWVLKGNSMRSVRCAQQSKSGYIAECYWEGQPEKVKVLYAKYIRLLGLYLSRAGHEKSCLKLGRPRSKAKYETATDSE